MAIDGKTELYGIMGNPVSHSLSPAMHNNAFKALGMNKAYLAFAVEDVATALDGFRALGIKGVSVTIPHKQAVIPLLDSIDPVAEKIGAVNTLIISNNHIHGLNTDWIGANRALTTAIDLKHKEILLLGAGGSARAIGFGLQEAGAKVILASRTPEKGKALADHLQCPWHPLEKANEIKTDALINATSVGMAPEKNGIPVPTDILADFPVVMDIVYAPLETRLLREAKAVGCKTIDGLSMLLYQGVAQFEQWTGREAPVAIMEKILRAQIK